MLKEININKEKELLYKTFEYCRNKVKDNQFCLCYAEEKIHHSMQVLGAGNYILKNEIVFQNKSSEYLKLAKLVSLFHDIGRFKEIEFLYQTPKSLHNHSYYSYEKLKELGYTDWRLLLPIKLHGKLANALYEDEEFKTIKDKNLAKEVEELYFLVRDADKIANLYIIKYGNKTFKDLFFENVTDETRYAPISSKVLKSLRNKILVVSEDCYSFSDRLLQIACFAFEIYYKPSFEYIYKHGLFDYIFSMMQQYNPDALLQKEIEKSINDFMIKRYSEL